MISCENVQTRENVQARESFQALYLHIPYCESKCAYCDFASFATPLGGARIEAYLTALLAHLGELASHGFLSEVKTAYIGGGTPSMLAESQLERLISNVSSACPKLEEFTLEANPESFTHAKAELAVAAGVSRFSLGVQSFVDVELQALGRIHSAERACEAIDTARATGADVSLDLMCALPHQTKTSWEYSLTRALELEPDHISVYPLAIEEGTHFHKLYGSLEPAWNAPEVQALRMEEAEALLANAGYARYEVANYARAGKMCKHNLSYWISIPYIALGTSAASMARLNLAQELEAELGMQLGLERRGGEQDSSRIRFSCIELPNAYAEVKQLSQLKLEVESLSAEQALSEDLMLYSRLNRPLDAALLERAKHCFGEQRMNKLTVELKQEGLLDSELRPTHEGWLRGNEIFSRYFELAF